MLLINATPTEIATHLKRAHLEDPVAASINAFLINAGSGLVLIDSGAGDSMGPGLGRVLGNLAAAEYRPDQVDEVFLTHMHPDQLLTPTCAFMQTHFSRAYQSRITSPGS